MVPTGASSLSRPPPLLAPPPPSLTRTEGHVATLDGLRLVPLAAPTTLAAFAYNLPLLDAFPAARRALRPDRQTDSQGWIGGSWHAPIATLEEYLLANNDSSAEYCFLIRVFPPPLQQTPNVLRWGAQGRYIPCLILSFPTNFGEKITGSHTFISIPMRPACSISTWPSHPAPIPLLPTPPCARGGGFLPLHQLTSDQAPVLHCAGQGRRLQGRRVSGRWPVQYLVCRVRLVPSCKRCTHCTARACTPSLPQDLLQAPHSSATQLPGVGKTDTAKALRGDARPGKRPASPP